MLFPLRMGSRFCFCAHSITPTICCWERPQGIFVLVILSLPLDKVATGTVWVAFIVVFSSAGIPVCFSKTQWREISWSSETTVAAHPQVKSYYKECCHCWHLCMMKRVFCHSTHLSESNTRPVYAFQLLFHLLPFILITSGALFLLIIWNSQRPLSE